MKVLRVLLFVISIVCATNVSAQTVYTTKTGTKYHKNNCRYLKYSKKELKIKEAKSLGYVACKVCKPSADNSTDKKEDASNSITTSSSKKKMVKKAKATQCTGKTKAGKRCKRMTKSLTGRCYQH